MTDLALTTSTPQQLPLDPVGAAVVAHQVAHREVLRTTTLPHELAELGRLGQLLRDVRQQLDAQVTKARRAGATWHAVAASAGIPKHTAWNRWAGPGGGPVQLPGRPSTSPREQVET